MKRLNNLVKKQPLKTESYLIKRMLDSSLESMDEQQEQKTLIDHKEIPVDKKRVLKTITGILRSTEPWMIAIIFITVLIKHLRR
jgi:hypothetical protein